MFWGRFRTRSDSIGHARGCFRTRSDSIGRASQRPWTRLDEWPGQIETSIVQTRSRTRHRNLTRLVSYVLLTSLITSGGQWTSKTKVSFSFTHHFAQMNFVSIFSQNTVNEIHCTPQSHLGYQQSIINSDIPEWFPSLPIPLCKPEKNKYDKHRHFRSSSANESAKHMIIFFSSITRASARERRELPRAHGCALLANEGLHHDYVC